MKMRTVMTAWPLVFVGALAPINGVTDDESMKRRFLVEYPPASRKLEDFYNNIRMSAVETSPIVRINRDSGPPIPEVTGWKTTKREFFASGSMLRLDSFPEGRTAYSTVKGPGLSFRVMRDSATGGYRVTSQNVNTSQENNSQKSVILNSFPIASISYGIAEETISEFLANHCTLKDVVRTKLPDGRVAVRVDWEKSRPADREQPGDERRGSFTFLPESSWALHHLVFLSPFKDSKTGENRIARNDIEIEYEGEHNGVPLVKRMRDWQGGPDSEMPGMTIEVVEIITGPVPEDAFTLEAFGLRTDPAPEPVPVMYYLLALSAMCGLLALLFTFLRRRSERPPGSA